MGPIAKLRRGEAHVVSLVPHWGAHLSSDRVRAGSRRHLPAPADLLATLELSVCEELIGCVGFAASISTASPAAVGRQREFGAVSSSHWTGPGRCWPSADTGHVCSTRSFESAAGVEAQ
jgi:hypothetical protein